MAKINLKKLAANEALKEFGRMLLIAVLPVVIDSLSQGNVELRTLGFAVLLAALRAIDRYLHKVESDNPITNFLRFE